MDCVSYRLPLHCLSTLGDYKVTTSISTKSAIQIGIRPTRRRTTFDTQSVTTLAFSSFATKRPETHFCRETWASSGEWRDVLDAEGGRVQLGEVEQQPAQGLVLCRRETIRSKVL